MGGGDDGGDGGAGQGASGGHVVYAEQFAPASAWAMETNDAHSLTRAGCLETLVKYTAEGELEPMLATEWTQVEPTTWEFTLREGVTFQDGTPMDAEAVAGALSHVLEVETPARAFNADVIAGVEAADEATVRISTPKPDPLVPLRVANANAGILAPKAYEGRQIDIVGTCTGPFTVTEEVPQQSLSLEANADYWGGEVTLDSAEVRFVIDGATRATQLQSGEVHIAKSLPVANLANLEGDDNLEIAQLELARTTVMLLNNSRPPFDDPLVRQAIQQAVDTQAIVDGVYEGAAAAAVGPFGPDTDWAPEGAEAVAPDLDEARALLDEAGVAPEDLSIQLLAYNDRPEFGDVAAVIQSQLGELGVDVKIKGGDYAAMEPDMLSGDFDAALLSRGYLVDVADPGGYLLSDWTCEGGYNIAHYCDPETDQQIQDAAAIEDTAERNAAYQELAAKLQEEAASVFLLHENAVWGLQGDVEGFQPHPLDYYVLTADLAVS
ncbi:peptide ABC transporter [Nocardioides gansuensis]|uniref:Peptide ABC transporter n=2 Tax=Nocardioides gansuensis TaxID=2138300 RepID=A0A2T8FBY4_9ACTN|nr:peptide ABC transporter [Nocardioides gansuensis]